MCLYFNIRPNLLTLDPIHRCRNRGGQDVSSCSSDLVSSTFDISARKHQICSSLHPFFTFCHISAFNDASQEVQYSFTDYQYFTAESAHSTCAEIGGKVPSVKNHHRQLQLEFVIEYLSSFVRYNRPYTLKWLTFPVRKQNKSHRFHLHHDLIIIQVDLII